MPFSNTLYLVCIVVVLGTVFTYIIMSDFSFTQPSPYPKQRRYSSRGGKISAYILILAQPRTGSSFLGEIFNQNPDVFYLYEPLYTFSTFKKLRYVTEKSHATLVAAFLRNVSSCHLNGFQDYFNFLSHPGLSSLHFRLSSKSLSTPPLCKSEAQSIDNQYEVLKKCPPLDARKVSLVCASKRFVAAKILTQRLPEMILQDLIDFHSRAEIPLKIIQLVRDPRAIVWSMIKLGQIKRGTKPHNRRTENNQRPKQEDTSDMLNERINSTFDRNFSKQVSLVCKKILKDINIYLQLSSKVSKDQYRLIRYEELAESTVTFASKIFEFTGMEFAPDVKQWFQQNNVLHKNSMNDRKLSYSTTNRNTTVTINSWRENLSLSETSFIEKQCADFMQNFGYKFVDNEEALTNISISLLRPLRKRFHTFL